MNGCQAIPITNHLHTFYDLLFRMTKPIKHCSLGFCKSLLACFTLVSLHSLFCFTSFAYISLFSLPIVWTLFVLATGPCREHLHLFHCSSPFLSGPFPPILSRQSRGGPPNFAGRFFHIRVSQALVTMSQ